MKRRWIRWAVAAASLVAIVALLRLTLFAPKRVAVTVYRVDTGRVESTVANSKAGTVKSRRRSQISPEVGGRVAALPVRKGERVRKGDVLVCLASDDLKAQVTLRARSVEAAAAAAREACRAAERPATDFKRTRSLAESQIASQGLLDQATTQRETSQAGCEASRARVQEASAALDVARVTLGKTLLLAPFDGVVAELATELGEYITPSPPGLPIPAVLELIGDGSLYVSAPLDEVDVGKVREGQKARVTFDAYPGKSWAGTVSRVAPYVLDRQEQNRTFEVEVTLEDRAFEKTLLPGTSADVEVVLGVRENVVRIPRTALIEGGRVLLVQEGRLVPRTVKPGLLNWELAEIREGLAPGDLVTVSLDRAEVKAGARVTVEADPAK